MAGNSLSGPRTGPFVPEKISAIFILTNKPLDNRLRMGQISACDFRQMQSFYLYVNGLQKKV